MKVARPTSKASGSPSGPAKDKMTVQKPPQKEEKAPAAETQKPDEKSVKSVEAEPVASGPKGAPAKVETPATPAAAAPSAAPADTTPIKQELLTMEPSKI